MASYDLLRSMVTNQIAFDQQGKYWLSATGGQGAPPKTTFAPLKFSKNNRKNNRNNSL